MKTFKAKGNMIIKKCKMKGLKMHYRKRAKPPRIHTEKYEIDTRLLDLLEIESKRQNTSRSRIFEKALLQCLESPDLPLKFKLKARKKFTIEEKTMELLENVSWEYEIPKNTLINKALTEYLTKREYKLKRGQRKC